MTRTINLSYTQFRYQIVFFIHIYGYVWLAEGCNSTLSEKGDQECPGHDFLMSRSAVRYVSSKSEA